MRDHVLPSVRRLTVSDAQQLHQPNGRGEAACSRNEGIPAALGADLHGFRDQRADLGLDLRLFVVSHGIHLGLGRCRQRYSPGQVRSVGCSRFACAGYPQRMWIRTA
jgi:hypothetical protein